MLHASALDVVANIPDDEFKCSRSGAPSIEFHLWHIARWADLLQSRLSAMTPEMTRRLGERRQIWDSGGYAEKWGFMAEQLGYEATGMRMLDDDAVDLPFPDRDGLMEYVRLSLDAANKAADAVDDEQSLLTGDDLYGRENSVSSAVLGHLIHASRHMGMIEALKGVYGMRGTATV